MEEIQSTENRPGTAKQEPQEIKGLYTTAKLMENYQLLREYAMTGRKEPAEQETDTGAILGIMRRSRDDTAIVVQEINAAMEQIRAAAYASGYGYKVEAFERHYLRGQTYEQIAEAMNAGRNSPARWCKEIMQKMAVRLFGVNGIG